MLGAEDEAATPAVVTTAAAWSARLAVGTASSGGGRPLQQDRVVVSLDLANLVPPPPPPAAVAAAAAAGGGGVAAAAVPPPAMDLVGVLDGHGFPGGRAADFLRQVRRMALCFTVALSGERVTPCFPSPFHVRGYRSSWPGTNADWHGESAFFFVSCDGVGDVMTEEEVVSASLHTPACSCPGQPTLGTPSPSGRQSSPTRSWTT